MKVDVFAVDCDGGGARVEARGVTLISCFVDYPHDSEYELVREQLTHRHDVAFVGGGEVQLFKLVRVG
jgi:hypothetical protein